jgi:hypothetical protein
MLLTSLAAREMPVSFNQEARGHYDYDQQKWIWLDENDAENPVWYMSGGTGDATTYSATSMTGRDNDSDDRGV